MESQVYNSAPPTFIDSKAVSESHETYNGQMGAYAVSEANANACIPPNIKITKAAPKPRRCVKIQQWINYGDNPEDWDHYFHQVTETLVSILKEQQLSSDHLKKSIPDQDILNAWLEAKQPISDSFFCNQKTSEKIKSELSQAFDQFIDELKTHNPTYYLENKDRLQETAPEKVLENFQADLRRKGENFDCNHCILEEPISGIGNFIVRFAEMARFYIAAKREGCDGAKKKKFGIRKDDYDWSRTDLNNSFSVYSQHGYLDRAVSLESTDNCLHNGLSYSGYDGLCDLGFQLSEIEEKNSFKNLNNLIVWKEEHLPECRPILITSRLNGTEIGLTQFLFFKQDNYKNKYPELSAKFFQKLDTENPCAYNEKTKETGLMMHPLGYTGKRCYPHIESLIEQVIHENKLSNLPRIHWLYVQATPVLRGPGGIAELLVASLFKLMTGNDLPEWRADSSPSMEVLTTPDEEKFVQEYHTLFAPESIVTEETFADQTDFPEIEDETLGYEDPESESVWIIRK